LKGIFCFRGLQIVASPERSIDSPVRLYKIGYGMVDQKFGKIALVRMLEANGNDVIYSNPPRLDISAVPTKHTHTTKRANITLPKRERYSTKRMSSAVGITIPANGPIRLGI
jgi:hypothetical protein